MIFKRRQDEIPFHIMFLLEKTLICNSSDIEWPRCVKRYENRGRLDFCVFCVVRGYKRDRK